MEVEAADKGAEASGETTREAVHNFLLKLDEFDLNDYMKRIHFDRIPTLKSPIHAENTKQYVGLEGVKRAELDFLRKTVLSTSAEPVWQFSDFPMAEMAADMAFSKKWMMGLAMTLIEYLAGLIFIVGMKVELWDYGNQWGNIQGIICPLFSVFWTILSAAYRFLLHPFFRGTVTWLFDHFTFIFVVGLFYGVLLVDVVWSFRLLARIRTFAKEHHIVVRLEEFKKGIAERAQKNRFGQFLLALQERSRSTADSLQDYFENLRRRTGEMMRKTSRRKLRKNAGAASPKAEEMPISPADDAHETETKGDARK